MSTDQTTLEINDLSVAYMVGKSSGKAVDRVSFEVKQGDFIVDRMLAADEVFLTGTTKKVVPVVKVDDQVIGQGKPGQVTKYLMEKFDIWMDCYIEEKKC